MIIDMSGFSHIRIGIFKWFIVMLKDRMFSQFVEEALIDSRRNAFQSYQLQIYLSRMNRILGNVSL